MVKSLERNIKKKETKETELKNTEKELQKLKIQEKQELKKFFDEAKVTNADNVFLANMIFELIFYRLRHRNPV